MNFEYSFGFSFRIYATYSFRVCHLFFCVLFIPLCARKGLLLLPLLLLLILGSSNSSGSSGVMVAVVFFGGGGGGGGCGV